MEKDHPLIPELLLKNLQIGQNVSNTKRTSRGPNSNRTLMRAHLTKQILEECLQSLDIFKQIMEDSIQRIKLVRDVSKTIQVKLFDQEAILFDKGDIAQCIYMVIKGEVSLCLPVIKENEDTQKSQTNNQEVEYDYQQIDTYGEGVGFGDAEFIHKRKRGLVAKVKKNDTVIGIIIGSAFEEIIQLYRQRVYYKKIQMFGKCPLLKMLQPYQLQFIVNNAKPIVFPISKKIVQIGERPKNLYLITEGQIELRKQPNKKQTILKHHQARSRDNLQQSTKNKIKIKNVVVGVLETGQFLGDCELALNAEYNFCAVCKSQKVRAYVCDDRIIMSQMTEENFQFAEKYYFQKNNYREDKMIIYSEAKSKIQKQLETHDIVTLNQKQMKIKRKIMNRYVQKTPTLIGQFSPRQIQKMIDKKIARIKTQPQKRQLSLSFPSINLMKSNQKRLKRNERAFSPLLKKSQQIQSKMTANDDYFSLKPIAESISYNRRQPLTIEKGQYQFTRSETKPLLVFMRPFHKKVESLHQRLAKQYNSVQNKKKKQLDRKDDHINDHSFSIMEMRRVCEFISKIKSHKKKQSMAQD